MGALPLLPMQAMTQQVRLTSLLYFLVVYHLSRFSYNTVLWSQATRHARRVYVGGLPPTANEQVFLYFLSIIAFKTTNFGDVIYDY